MARAAVPPWLTTFAGHRRGEGGKLGYEPRYGLDNGKALFARSSTIARKVLGHRNRDVIASHHVSPSQKKASRRHTRGGEIGATLGGPWRKSGYTVVAHDGNLPANVLEPTFPLASDRSTIAMSAFKG